MSSRWSLAPTPEQARHNQYVVAFAEWLRRHRGDVPVLVLAAEIEEEGSSVLAEIVDANAPNWLTRVETQSAAVKAAVAAERARCAAVCRVVGLSWQGDDDDLESAAARMALSEAREFITDGRAATAVPRTGGA